MTAGPGAGPDELAHGVLAGRARSIGRAISEVERDSGVVPDILRRLFPKTGRARIIGITGPPGAGKSTLVQRLAQAFRREGRTVGIVAVDPSSPFTGGAILGDRIRMAEIYTDPGVFIRSMATRGSMGGLARATSDAVDVLDAAGFDWVLVETVGVGQDEVDVVRSVDTVVVVTVPGLGDDIQAIKAGIMEIADVFVINKADREGVERTARDLQASLELDQEMGAWLPPILRTVASLAQGIEELFTAITRHRAFLDESGELAARRRSHLRLRIESILKDRVLAAADREHGLERAIERAFADRTDPYSVADALFADVARRAATPAAEPPHSR